MSTEGWRKEPRGLQKRRQGLGREGSLATERSRSCFSQGKMKAEQAGKGQERVGKLGPDGLMSPPPRWKGSGLSDMLPSGYSVPLPPLSKIRRESHGDLGGQPTSWDLL